MANDMDLFVINNMQDDFCRQCGSYECNGCGCTRCRENQAKYFNCKDQFNRNEQLCQNCYNDRAANLAQRGLLQ
jgi:hypothetical protein